MTDELDFLDWKIIGAITIAQLKDLIEQFEKNGVEDEDIISIWIEESTHPKGGATQWRPLVGKPIATLSKFEFL